MIGKWLAGRREARQRAEDSLKALAAKRVADRRPPTLGDVRSILLGYNPNSLLTLTVVQHEGEDFTATLVDEITVRAFYPIRDARPDEPSYIRGLYNKVIDYDQTQRVLIRLGTQAQVCPGRNPVEHLMGKPLRVYDLLTAMVDLPDDLICVDSASENACRTQDARWIRSQEIRTTRLLLWDEPGYVEGCHNRTYEAQKRVSLFIGQTDYSIYNYG